VTTATRKATKSPTPRVLPVREGRLEVEGVLVVMEEANREEKGKNNGRVAVASRRRG
jgi:hypothetical protein